MTYDWYFIFNLTDFEALDLTSKTYEFILADRGLVEILVTKGNLVSALFDDVFLPLSLNDQNPREIDERAVFIDANNDVYVGVLVED